VLVSSVVTRSAAGRIEPPSVQGERLAETVLVPVDVVDDPAVVRLAARLAMAKGGGVLVGAVAGASGEQLDSARRRAREAEELASATGAEAESTVRVDTSATAGLAAIVAEPGVTLVVTGWHKAAVAADVLLGGENVDLVAIVDAPVLAVLRAHDGCDRVVLALDSTDLSDRRAAERDLAIAVASIAASASRGAGRSSSCPRTGEPPQTLPASSATTRSSSSTRVRGGTRWRRSRARRTLSSCRRAPEGRRCTATRCSWQRSRSVARSESLPDRTRRRVS
jgi:hypothetical protein